MLERLTLTTNTHIMMTLSCLHWDQNDFTFFLFIVTKRAIFRRHSAHGKGTVRFGSVLYVTDVCVKAAISK